MIDIHTHILPNVDDGANSLENSLNMLRQAYEQGVTHLVLTPHAIIHSKSYIEKEELQQRFEKLKEACSDIPIKLYLGSEIYYTDKVLERLQKKELQTFGGSKYFLIEFSMRDENDLDEILYNFKVRGYKPILAHPERYEYLDLKKLKILKEHALIQVNTTSIEGVHGKKVKNKVFDFLKAGLVDFVSSDCHDAVLRKCSLKDSYDIVSKKFGKAYADKIFRENQLKMIEDIEKGLAS